MEAGRRQRYLEVLGLKDWLAVRADEHRPGPASVRVQASEPRSPDGAGGAIRGEQEAARTALPDSAALHPGYGPPVSTQRTFTSLEEARTCVAECTACGLHTTRTQTVFGVGPDRAPLMVIGEGPGAEEDRRGEPFVGRAGQLLDQMLAAIGHSRTENCYIGNVVKCRPPNNRDPAPDEVTACRGYLDAQIALVRPKLILAVGRIAAQRLLDSSEPLSKLRGRVHHYGAGEVPVWVTYHPAYLLRSPREKGRAWEDLKRAHALLAEAGDGAGQ